MVRWRKVSGWQGGNSRALDQLCTVGGPFRTDSVFPYHCHAKCLDPPTVAHQTGTGLAMVEEACSGSLHRPSRTSWRLPNERGRTGSRPGCDALGRVAEMAHKLRAGRTGDAAEEPKGSARPVVAASDRRVSGRGRKTRALTARKRSLHKCALGRGWTCGAGGDGSMAVGACSWLWRGAESLRETVILSHNHPSGIAELSQADEIITTRLRDALALIDVRVLDHLIIAGPTVTSLAERGALCPPPSLPNTRRKPFSCRASGASAFGASALLQHALHRAVSMRDLAC